MKKGNDDKRGTGELLESAFFLLLPLLCIASIMRGCSARSAEIPDMVQQTATGQQYVTTDTEDTF